MIWPVGLWTDSMYQPQLTHCTQCGPDTKHLAQNTGKWSGTHTTHSTPLDWPCVLASGLVQIGLCQKEHKGLLQHSTTCITHHVLGSCAAYNTQDQSSSMCSMGGTLPTERKLDSALNVVPRTDLLCCLQHAPHTSPMCHVHSKPRASTCCV